MVDIRPIGKARTIRGLNPKREHELASIRSPITTEYRRSSSIRKGIGRTLSNRPTSDKNDHGQSVPYFPSRTESTTLKKTANEQFTINNISVPPRPPQQPVPSPLPAVSADP
jgi:hypothetical protein